MSLFTHRLSRSILAFALAVTYTVKAPVATAGNDAVKGAAAAGAALLIFCVVTNCTKTKDGNPPTTKKSGPQDAVTLNSDQRMHVQRGLAAKGNYFGAIDGAIGPGTRKAIRQYQASIGARASGYLTKLQIEDLMRSSPKYATLGDDDDLLFEIEFTQNVTPVEVKEIQSLLNFKGYPSGTPDGKVGKGTRSAIAAYKNSVFVGGQPIATTRLLAKLQGLKVTPITTPKSSTVVGSADQGVSKLETGIKEVAVLNAGAIFEEENLVSLDILDVSLGTPVDEVENILVMSWSDGKVTEHKATKDIFQGNEIVNSGSQYVFESIGGKARENVAIVFDEEFPEYGVIGIFREALVPAGVSTDSVMVQLIKKYGMTAKVTGGLLWIENQDIKKKSEVDPSVLNACGAAFLDFQAPVGAISDKNWGQPNGPVFDPEMISSFGAGCGGVLNVSISDGKILFNMWNSNFIFQRKKMLDGPVVDTGLVKEEPELKL